MNRRAFIRSAWVASSQCRSLLARRIQSIQVIGFLSAQSSGPVGALRCRVSQWLAETGYVEGKNVAMNFVGPRAATIDCPRWCGS
jgi:hypothetical protein